MTCGNEAYNKERPYLNVNKINNSAVQNFKGVNAQKILTKAANINSWQQRLALGASAMAIQPMIDMRNKNIEPETRQTSAKRSFAKALVGMSTGIVVRGGCMKAVEVCLSKDKFVHSLAKITSEDKTKEAILKAEDFIKNQGGAKKYASVIGTITAIGVMLFTNFMVDAPITNMLTKKINQNAKNKKEDTRTNQPANCPIYSSISSKGAFSAVRGAK